MTLRVVGLLALRPTEFIELKRLAVALLRGREFQPVFLVHQGSPVFLAHQSQFEGGEIPTVFVNLNRIGPARSWAKLWWPLVWVWQRIDVRRARLASWMCQHIPEAVQEFLVQYRAQAEQIRESTKILREHHVSLLVVGEDGVGADLGTVSACRDLGRPVMVLPYEYSTVDQPLHYILSNAHIFKACVARSLPRRLLSTLRPQWTIDCNGEQIFREPLVRMLANVMLGIAPKLPWTVHGGRADVIAAESEFLANAYIAEGVPPKKVVTTGSFALDKLALSLNERAEYRNRFGKIYGIDPNKPILLCAFPPDYFQAENEFEFKNYFEMIEFWISCARAVTSNVIFQCHPAVSEQERQIIAESTGRLASEAIVELVAASDFLATSVSSIIRFAIAAGHPVVNFDIYRFRYRDYRGVPGVMHAETAAEFRAALENGWTICQNQNFVSRSSSENPAWGKLDGSGGLRIVELIRRLVGRRKDDSKS